MYIAGNPKNKKEIKEMLAKKPDGLDVFSPGGLGNPPTDGYVGLEGPHYPKAHTWYAEGTMKNGKLVAIK